MTGIRLSPTQLKAVNHRDGALLVVAGPGSGKTRVLTERIRRILKEEQGHFRILALTFTNKAANEMKERLVDVAEISERATISTLHSFCTEVLAERGKPVGVEKLPQIISSSHDRKLLLLQAVNDDPELLHDLKSAGDQKEQGKKLDDWLRRIISQKSFLLYGDEIEDESDRKIYDAYNAALRASDSLDFDDLLLLTYRLFQERPKIAEFYQRLYRYICIDEAQDLNNAQYGVLKALCGDTYKNVMMVGDPKQSIYGFNTADPKLMDAFKKDFGATVIELNENFRSSSAVVASAQSLNSAYEVKGILPIRGAVSLIIGQDEADEAKQVVAKLRDLLKTGHPDIEGSANLENCAVLGRTRYTLLKIEEELKESNIEYYKQLGSNYESESALMKSFELCLKLLVNPKDRLHLDILKKRWKIEDASLIPQSGIKSGMELVRKLVKAESNIEKDKIEESLALLTASESDGLQFTAAFKVLEDYANTLGEEEKREIWEDVQVLRGEWDRYLRAKIGNRSDLATFLTHMALGTTQQPKQAGLALLTVHSAKGLEFDVIFVVGMSDGTFPDYRAQKNKEAMAEERRNAFVAITRSKRLLFLSYPKTKKMPWGDIWQQKPSQFLKDMKITQ
jgi:DNA helicase-2/ATP-dependent DNA helicase PcrA